MASILDKERWAGKAWPVVAKPTSKKPAGPVQLRLRVTAAAEKAIRSGHPWVFSESIRERNREGGLGDLAAIYDRSDRFLAMGLFDPFSPLTVRVLHRGKPTVLDETWWQGRLQEALERRHGLFDAQTTGYRCIHGESDGWPGLVLDRYERTFVIKLYTAAWLSRLEDIRRWVVEACQPERIALRWSRNLQNAVTSFLGHGDSHWLYGDAPAHLPTFLESGLRFETDPLRGQKTGFFLDQRENRRRVETLAAGRRVLNAFSFSGGFSLYAARGGARSVTDVDLSQHALDAARRNFALNASCAAVRDAQHHTVRADAFPWLESQARQRFDLVILDPPSMAQRASDRARALQAYRRLVRAGVALMDRGGILAAASCSAQVAEAEFFEAVRGAVHSSGRRISVLGTAGHPVDHPANFPEAHYLKCIYLRLE